MAKKKLPERRKLESIMHGKLSLNDEVRRSTVILSVSK